MLAYVFWHQPRDAVDPQAYEARLCTFHDALAVHPPTGFRESAAFRIRGGEWAPPAPFTYEDWYLLENSAALDVVNDAAVTGVAGNAHDFAAAYTAWGTAGLYRLRHGTAFLGAVRTAAWTAKPPETDREEFYATVGRTLQNEPFAIWGRQMVLGPTPEFCIHLRRQTELGLGRTQWIDVDRLWPHS